MLLDSAATVSLVPSAESVDAKFAVELGLSIMLDKPLILVVAPGTRIPDRLVRVADAIVEGELSSPDLRERLNDAVRKVLGE